MYTHHLAYVVIFFSSVTSEGDVCGQVWVLQVAWKLELGAHDVLHGRVRGAAAAQHACDDKQPAVGPFP